MASTNKTTNYELSQFIETDRPAWLTDYNGDMRKLDTALKAVSDVASDASGGISSLTDRMTTAEGAITTNANDITALDARADALETGAQSTAGTIANIQTEQMAQNLGIEAATELGYNLARPYDSASTYAVGAYVLFQNTLYKCVTAVNTGEAFDPTKWTAIKATDEIAAGGYTLPIASASQLGGVKVGSGLSIDPATGILNASGGGGGEYYELDANNSTINLVGTSEYRLTTDIFNSPSVSSILTGSNMAIEYDTNRTNFIILYTDRVYFSLNVHLSHTLDTQTTTSKNNIKSYNVIFNITSDKFNKSQFKRCSLSSRSTGDVTVTTGPASCYFNVGSSAEIDPNKNFSVKVSDMDITTSVKSSGVYVGITGIVPLNIT